MARPVNTGPSGKGERENGRKHLNASLPQQLVFDFNEVAKRQGHGRRDALVEQIFRWFLETVEPTSKSLRDLPASGSERFSSRDAAAARQQMQEREVIRIVRERAQEIVEITSELVTRKPPRRAAAGVSSRRKQKAS